MEPGTLTKLQIATFPRPLELLQNESLPWNETGIAEHWGPIAPVYPTQTLSSPLATAGC